MRGLLLLVMLAVVTCAAADSVRAQEPALPSDAVKYEPAKVTQSLSRLAAYQGAPLHLDTRRVLPVRIQDLPNTDWHQSGGMKGITGVTAEKYRSGGKAVHRWAEFELTFTLPSGGKGTIKEMGIGRTYPDGTRFDDVLKYNGKVFEHRVREKVKGMWVSRVASKNPENFPPKYNGLTVTCASCHEQAGTGGYDKGLVPGGDTVFSDPLDWSVVPQGVTTR